VASDEDGRDRQDPLQSFTPEDRELVFRFLALFARYECALKHSGFVKQGTYGEADADWNTYADPISPLLARLGSKEYVKARSRLLQKPPAKTSTSSGMCQAK
jgi:hypothetical protein